MGVFGSALASLCHFTVLQRAGATNATLVTLIMPLTPIVLGGVFLGDRLSPRDMLGALVIAAALIIIDGRALRRGRTERDGRDMGSGPEPGNGELRVKAARERPAAAQGPERDGNLPRC